MADSEGKSWMNWTLGPVPGRQTVTASAPGLLRSPITFTEDAVPGRAHQLAFKVQPSEVRLGAQLSPAVQVAVQDKFGNLVTSSEHTIFLGLAAPAASKVQLQVSDGSLKIAATTLNGVATFSNVTFSARPDLVSSEERLLAEGNFFAPVIESAPFTVRR